MYLVQVVIIAKQMHEWHIQCQTNDGSWEILAQ
jgi:hypothetical protein